MFHYFRNNKLIFGHRISFWRKLISVLISRINRTRKINCIKKGEKDINEIGERCRKKLQGICWQKGKHFDKILYILFCAQTLILLITDFGKKTTV